MTSDIHFIWGAGGQREAQIFPPSHPDFLKMHRIAPKHQANSKMFETSKFNCSVAGLFVLRCNDKASCVAHVARATFLFRNRTASHTSRPCAIVDLSTKKLMLQKNFPPGKGGVDICGLVPIQEGGQSRHFPDAPEMYTVALS